MVPAIIKGCHSHSLNAGVSMSLGQDPYLSRGCHSSSVPYNYLTFAMPIFAHTTQHSSRVREATVNVGMYDNGNFITM